MRMVPLLLLAACATRPSEGPAPFDSARPLGRAPLRVNGDLSRRATPIADAFRPTAARIIAAALADDGAYRKLEFLTDHIGHRLSGSPQLERAVVWAQEAMRADGHENVHAEKVMVPRWIRGQGSAEIVAPVSSDMKLLALGSSPSTPKQGITADVMVVEDVAALDALADGAVRGKIVLFNKKMQPYSEKDGTGYGDTSKIRTEGPDRASQLGASAALVRSITARSLRTPHAGSTKFKDGKPIPAAAVTIEDAELLARLAASGHTPRVRLTLSSRMAGEAESANVVGELRGREKPDEIVVLACHLDSWDVGQGAHDDGTGCVMMMQTLTLLRTLGLQPRRTIRAVLYTNEENGIRGALAYPIQHKDELDRHVAGLESDGGGFAPKGFHVQGSDKTVAQVSDIASLLEPLGATRIEPGFAGVDIMTLAPSGIPLLGLQVDASRYFDSHHTDADTLDKVNPDELRKCLATVAVMAYVLAEMPERLDLIPEGDGRKLPF